MITSSSTLRNMLFEALDLLDSVQDQLVSLDRMQVEQLKEMSGWEQQLTARGADFRGEVPALQSAIVQGERLS